jgi:hypothetical protein
LTFQKFDSLGEWAEEKFRFMEIDVQGNSLWYWMITAFDAAGNARLIKYGEAHSWPELEQISITHKVVLPTGERAHHVGVDGNYMTGDVAKQTVLRGVDDVTTDAEGNQWREHFGWLMFRGDDRKRFKWPDGIERAIGPQEWYSEGFAEDLPPARQHWWSNYAIKNLVASIRDGHNKLKLVVNTTDENLNAQLYSEYPDEFGNWKQKSADNHFWDTLCMAYAHGLLAGIPFLGADEKVPV